MESMDGLAPDLREAYALLASQLPSCAQASVPQRTHLVFHRSLQNTSQVGRSLAGECEAVEQEAAFQARGWPAAIGWTINNH